MEANQIFANSKIINQNITVVFDNLDTKDIDINAVKKIMGEEAVITILPELLVAIDPKQGIIAQFGDRRLRVTFQPPTDAPKNIWHLTWELIKLSSPNLKAYGFNFDLISDLNPGFETTDYRFLFPNDLNQLESKINSRIIKFTPRFSFMHNDDQVDITLEPIKPATTRTHVNIHHPTSEIPEEDALGAAFSGNMEDIRGLITQLFTR